MDFIEALKQRARQNPKRILFAEGNEPRVLEAAALIEKEGLAVPILFTKEVENPHEEATKLLLQGEADAMISGPSAPSRERILPVLKLIGAKEKGQRVSGAMIMILPPTVDPDATNGGILFFADCAVNISPSPQELAQIAVDTADTAKSLGIDPIVALLSFSTAGSTDHPLTLRIREAAALARKLRPNLPIEGEVQVDAALIDSIGHKKDPDFALAGKANVLIFPELEAGNIGYKLVERLAGATVIGPVLQGLAKPVNELSRGSSVEDIVNLAALTCIQAQ